jgi:dimeric dUTPase (all-alpha-NTP-PPase superfamily)
MSLTVIPIGTSMKAKIIEMLTLQDQVNRVVNENWKSLNHPWYRAAMVESIEMLEHYGFKWWKKQEPDMAQVQLELVDIWHFLLSHYLQTNDDLALIAEQLIPADNIRTTADFRALIDRFVSELAGQHQFNITIFYQLLANVELSFDDLYLQYVGKNTLNRFRQHNGYKDGSYIKIWNGLEDNEVLFKILADIKPEQPSVAEYIYSELKNHYPS